ncbi:MAG: YkgJ family cysteine cluster protein [Pirellulales bacterium]
MTTEPHEPRPMATATFTIENEQFRLQAQVAVPSGPIRPIELLPLARALSDQVVSQTCRNVEASGQRISCRAGCGACCRNLVAISEVEARRISEVVTELPEPRQSEIRRRFAEARHQLDQTGLLQLLQDPDQLTDDDYARLCEVYFRQNVDCPFLEDGACSIYAERPITCREFLVTSPPEYCARPGSEGVERVTLPLTVFHAVARWQVPPSAHFLERWVPLILAPEWAAQHPDTSPPRPGIELLQDLLAQFNAGDTKSD